MNYEKSIGKALEDSIKGDKSAEDLIEDGAACERLLKNRDFARYQKLLIDSYVQLVKRMLLAQRDDLITLQGAMIQHDLISRMPEKVVNIAARIAEERREKTEA